MQNDIAIVAAASEAIPFILIELASLSTVSTAIHRIQTAAFRIKKSFN